MKIAISVPDALFNAADRLARELKVSRSQLYSEAVAAYLGSRGADTIRAQLDAVYARQPSAPDPVLHELALRALDPDEAW